MTDPELERALRSLEEAAEFAKTYRFEQTEDYLALIARVEAMPQNLTADSRNSSAGVTSRALPPSARAG